MTNSVFLFTGEEKYLLHQELRRWRQGFLDKFGPDSLLVFDAQNVDFLSVKQAIYAGGLFVSKKMVVILGVPMDSDSSNKISSSFLEHFTDEFVGRKGVVPEGTLLVLVSYKPDKRTRLFSFLKDVASIKTFDPLKDQELIGFVKQHLSVQISDDIVRYFLERVGSDLYHIVHECEKLRIWCSVSGVSFVDKHLIDLVSFGFVESNSFAFFDVLLHDVNSALALLCRAQEEGLNWNMFLGTLYRGLKLWILFLDLYEQGITDSKELVSILKAHPFVVSKLLKNVLDIRRCRVQISCFYSRLVDLEYKIKTGKIPDGLFWLDVKRLLVELF